MSSDLYSTVIPWLFNVHQAELVEEEVAEHHVAPTNSQHPTIDSTSLSEELWPDELSFPILNSFHRSTLELLESLPSPSDINQLLPILPTQIYSFDDLVKGLPNKTTGLHVCR